MLWERGRLASGEVGPCASWRLVPGPSPLPWMMRMSSSAMHTGLPASKPTHEQVDTAHTFPGWRFPSTGRLAGALCRIAGSWCCSVSSVVTSWSHLSWHTSSSGFPDPTAHLAGSHHQHILLQNSQAKSNVSPASASSARCQGSFPGCPGQQPCPCGVTHPMVSTTRVCREGP